MRLVVAAELPGPKRRSSPDLCRQIEEKREVRNEAAASKVVESAQRRQILSPGKALVGEGRIAVAVADDDVAAYEGRPD